MPNTLKVVSTNHLRSLKGRSIRYNVRLTGAYVQAVRGANTGEVLNLGTATGTNEPEQYWGYQGPSPTGGKVINSPAGTNGKILPGADGLHWLLQLWVGANELAAGNYTAGQLADLDIYIEFDGPSYK